MGCYDYKCSFCGYIQEENHSYKLITNKENDIKHKIICQQCNAIDTMERIISAVPMGMYSSTTSEQKKEMLKKRSHEHFKKNIEESFHEKNKKAFTP